MLITYAALAAELRAAADRLAQLGEQGVKAPQHASLYLSFGYVTSPPATVEENVQAVTAAAAALGLTAATQYEGRGANRTGEHKAANGHDTALHLSLRTSVPAPPTRAQKLADLQRENDALRAQLASAGGQA